MQRSRRKGKQKGSAVLRLSESPDVRVPVTEIRDDLSNLVNRVVYGGDRIILQRHGKDVAALISFEDLQFLETLETQMDLNAARASWKEKGAIPWQQVKEKLGL